jgi:hypothetical protein
MKKAASEVSNYMEKWKIGINGTKTNALYITRRRTRHVPQGPLEIFNARVEWTSQIKYLGVILDKSLTFKSHIDYVIERANIAIRVLYPLLCRRSRLHVENKILIYKLAIRPILTYGLPALSEISKSQVKRLQIIQNKALKMILDRSHFEHTQVIHDDTNMPLMANFICKLTENFERRRT